jgi:hypothetical protein
MIFSGACERVLLQQGAIADLSSWWQRHAVVQWQAETASQETTAIRVIHSLGMKIPDEKVT